LVRTMDLHSYLMMMSRLINSSPIANQSWVTVKEGKSILRVGKEDSSQAQPGDVRCQLEAEEVKFRIISLFKLNKMEESEEFIKDDDHRLVCKIRDGSDVQPGDRLLFAWSFKPDIEGRLDNETEWREIQQAKPDELAPHRKFRDYREERKSELQTNDATADDRGWYRCTVTRKRASEEDRVSSTQTMVRVKDRYAALYPFLGIVAEVVALVVIIFACEKGKSQDVDDDDDDGVTGSASGPGNGSSNLRHRRP